MSESIQAIRDFIQKHGYTYKVGDIFEDYRNSYKKGYYCSYTMNHAIENNIHHLKVIDNYFRKKGR